jgi:V/A-type H+/Na+-transporting ATPase subunit F
MKFFCIGDDDTAMGFRLAGIPTRSATTAEHAQAAVSEALAQGDCGILIITERLADAIRPRIEAIRSEREDPLIVEIPGAEGPLPGRKSLRDLVQEAVGMRIS